MTFNQYFTPLGKEYCVYFYYLSVIGFAFFWLALIGGLYMGIVQKEKPGFYMQIMMICLTYLIVYFKSRLLYSMCIN
jgi:hypothetical protein